MGAAPGGGGSEVVGVVAAVLLTLGLSGSLLLSLTAAAVPVECPSSGLVWLLALSAVEEHDG